MADDLISISPAMIRRFQNVMYKSINTRLNKYGGDLVDELADSTAEGVKTRFSKRAEPKDGTSQALLNEIVYSVHTEKDESGEGKFKNRVKVPLDRQHLVLYLEYGTGIKGENDPHPESNDRYTNWNYDVNKEWHMADGGFFVRKGLSTYLTREDIDPAVTYKSYVTKKTKEKRIYKHTTKNWAYSWGMKPLRAIYDSKIALREVTKRLSADSKNGKVYKKLPRDMKNLLERN